MRRRDFLKWTSAAAGGVALSAVSGFWYGTRLETEWLEVTQVEVAIPRLPPGLEGFRIVQLADFHLYPHTRIEFIRQVVDQASRLKADLGVLVGDFVLARADAIFDLAPVLAGLNTRQGLFAVLGNHDHWRGVKTVSQGLSEAGISLLVNQGVTLVHQREHLYLAGLDDAWVARPDLGAAMQKYGGKGPVILLAHEPDPGDQYSLDPRIALQLSGHSHGGQVRLPGLGSPFLPPYGRKYDLGLYRVRHMWLYTNRGIGVTAPIRLNCRPELTEITLVRSS